MMHGAFFLPCSNRSRTRLRADADEHLDEIRTGDREERNVRFAGDGLCAASVLPVPGGPPYRTPLGILPPSFWNFCGSFRNSMISCSSSLASSDAGDVFERHTLLLIIEQLCSDLPKLRALVAAGLHLPQRKREETHQQDERQRVDKHQPAEAA